METRLTHLLAFYRSEHVNQNWLATLTVIVDVAALIKAAMPDKGAFESDAADADHANRLRPAHPPRCQRRCT